MTHREQNNRGIAKLDGILLDVGANTMAQTLRNLRLLFC
jgi:hypothetical protein